MKKETVFKIITISLPFLVLFLLEYALRIGGYGENYQLFNRVKVENKPNYLIMNTKVSNKYFKNNGFKSDNPYDLFLETKTDSTFRIFVQGASTVVGFPYYSGGTFPRMLKHRLSQTFPEKNIEVISTGITAVNSYTLLDLTDKIIEQKPDLVLIYAGHNEYYGALGVGSSSTIGSYPRIIRTYLWLKNYRFFQLLDNTYSKIVNTISNKPSTSKFGETTLMEVMAKEQSIPYNSEIYKAGLDQFEGNMERLLKKYKENNIPVIISTLISNEKDVRPFISEIIEDNYQFNADLENNISNATLLAQNNALAAYKLGQHYLTKNQDSAKKYLQAAKELDLLRFRAPDKINNIIVDLAEQYNYPTVNMEDIFLANSSEKVIGDELMTEHVHPNIKGYFLMADAFYNKIKDLNFLNNWDNYISFDEAYQDIPITAVDSIKGALIVEDLKNSWPYNLNMAGSLPPRSFNSIMNRSYDMQRAIDIYTNQIAWKDAMAQLYNTYKFDNEYKKALRVAQSLILEFPEQSDVYKMAGIMCLNLNDLEKASYYFYKYNQLEKSSKSAQLLASVYIKLNKMELANKILLDVKKRGFNDDALNDMLTEIQIVVK